MNVTVLEEQPSPVFDLPDGRPARLIECEDELGNPFSVIVVWCGVPEIGGDYAFEFFTNRAEAVWDDEEVCAALERAAFPDHLKLLGIVEKVEVGKAGLGGVERTNLCEIINVYGDGGHPFAEERSLNYFAAAYALKCVENAINCVKPDHPGMAIALEIKRKLAAVVAA